jgi:hypothetical protein
MTYIYVKKDLTFMKNAESQTLLKAFLTALYTDEYITQCEEEFGFVRVDGALRDKALAAIDALVVADGAPEWTFEFNTDLRVGQGDYVISVKRASWSEVEQDNMVETIDMLTEEVKHLEEENAILMSQLGLAHTHDESQAVSGAYQLINNELTEDDQVKAALVLSSISFAFWMIAILFMMFRCVTGSHTPAGDSGIPKHEEAVGEMP